MTNIFGLPPVGINKLGLALVSVKFHQERIALFFIQPGQTLDVGRDENNARLPVSW